MSQLVGKQHTELLAYLKGPWMDDGPPVCVIEGAPGVGKTSLARELEGDCGRAAVLEPFPESCERDDLLSVLAAGFDVRELVARIFSATT